MRRWLLVGLLFLLTACGMSAEEQARMNQVHQDARANAPESYYRMIDVDGVKCIVVVYSTQNQPISCNWEAYNRQQEK